MSIQNVAATLNLNSLSFTTSVLACNLTGSPLAFVNNSSSAAPVISQSSSLGQSLSMGITLQNNLTLSGTGTGSLTFNGILSGNGTLTAGTADTVNLLASNTYSGGTILNSGILAINNHNALGTDAKLAINGGELRSTTNVVLANAYSDSSSTPVTFAAASNTTLTLASPAVSLSGAISLIFGNATDTGTINFQPSIVSYGLDAHTMAINGGTLVDGNGVLAGLLSDFSTTTAAALPSISTMTTPPSRISPGPARFSPAPRRASPFSPPPISPAPSPAPANSSWTDPSSSPALTPTPAPPNSPADPSGSPMTPPSPPTPSPSPQIPPSTPPGAGPHPRQSSPSQRQQNPHPHRRSRHRCPQPHPLRSHQRRRQHHHERLRPSHSQCRQHLLRFPHHQQRDCHTRQRPRPPIRPRRHQRQQRPQPQFPGQRFRRTAARRPKSHPQRHATHAHYPLHRCVLWRKHDQGAAGSLTRSTPSAVPKPSPATPAASII